MTYFQKAYFEVKKQEQCKRAPKWWKEVKNTAKYDETITELKRKGQIRTKKQISYWSTLKLNTLNKTASEPSSEDLEDISSNNQTETSCAVAVYKSDIP